jgi:nucleotide-binding universal stress UspA family protein
MTYILVPLDGSALAEKALPLDIAIARLTSSELILLRVVPPRTGVEAPTEVTAQSGQTSQSSQAGRMAAKWQEEVSGAREYLDQIAGKLREAGLQVRMEIVNGAPAAAIVEYAERDPEVWLIGMATRHCNLDRPRASWAFGSVAEKVLHTAHKPVLLIRPSTEYEVQGYRRDTPINKIIVPLDGSRFAEGALPQASHLALVTGAVLVLIYAVAPHDNHTIEQVEHFPGSADIARGYEATRMSRYLADIALQLRGEGLDVLTQLVYGYPAESILSTAGQLQGDLIVMAARTRSDRERLWLGSVAQKVAQGSTLPILIQMGMRNVG